MAGWDVGSKPVQRHALTAETERCNIVDDPIHTTRWQPNGPSEPLGAPPNEGSSVVPTTRIPLHQFRWKGTTLQQAFTGTGGGQLFWVNVPTVPGNASDVG